jgi:ABC-type branched-subunit amino acid transport system ATPase component
MNLSHGEMRLLELGRALATSPKLLLMDEQASGLSASEVDNLKRLVREIRDSGITILIIEHLMEFVMDLSDHVIVLNYGQKIFEGTPEEAQNDQEVITAYLGKEVDL